MPKIIGLRGKARSGKDTVASILSGKGWTRKAFADQLKRSVGPLFGLSHDQLNGADDSEALDPREQVDPRWGKTPRVILQECGEAWRKIHPDVWCKFVLADIEELYREDDQFVITDVRYKNEADMIRKMGGVMVHVVRPGAESRTGRSHSSETEMDSYKRYDFTIDNSKDIPHLERQVAEMLRTCAAALGKKQ